jgi:pyrroline-5-carboxylate reductase
MVVGFIGSGNMAAAMARGWAAADGDAPSTMLFTDSGSGRATALANEVGGEAVRGNDELVRASDFVILAMKPNGLDGVAEKLPVPRAVLSLLGATRLSRLTGLFPDSTVLRLMPNLGVEAGRGVIAVAEDGTGDRESVADALKLLGALGAVVELPDDQMDAATAVMGCSPAYFAVVADALARSGVADGLEPDVAIHMVAESLAGTGELLKRRTPFEIQVAVASPGGSTEAGLDALKEARGAEAFEAAAAASLARMRGA